MMLIINIYKEENFCCIWRLPIAFLNKGNTLYNQSTTYQGCDLE